MRSHSLAAALALALAATAGCGGTPCPDDVPVACPTPAPSFSAEVLPIIEDTCFPCHGPGGGQASNRLLADYDHVFALRAKVLHEVADCYMPPSPEPELTPEQRAAVLGWLVCGAPDN